MPAISPEYGNNNNFNILFTAQYYKSTNQNLVSGANDITFDSTQPWNDTGGYITHPNNTPNFTVVIPGLYQLEWNISVLGSGSTSSTLLKQISIDITRSPLIEQVTIAQNALISTGSNYGQSLSATFYLEAGDVINCRVVNTFTGTATVLGKTGGSFDLNTWFTWRFIK